VCRSGVARSVRCGSVPRRRPSRAAAARALGGEGRGRGCPRRTTSVPAARRRGATGSRSISPQNSIAGRRTDRRPPAPRPRRSATAMKDFPFPGVLAGTLVVAGGHPRRPRLRRPGSRCGCREGRRLGHCRTGRTGRLLIGTLQPPPDQRAPTTLSGVEPVSWCARSGFAVQDPLPSPAITLGASPRALSRDPHGPGSAQVRYFVAVASTSLRPGCGAATHRPGRCSPAMIRALEQELHGEAVRPRQSRHRADRRGQAHVGGRPSALPTADGVRRRVLDANTGPRTFTVGFAPGLIVTDAVQLFSPAPARAVDRGVPDRLGTTRRR